MTDGISSKLYLKAKFLGTFSVVLDDSVEEVNLRSVNIAVGVTGGLLLLLFLVALILDIMSKSRDYPH